MCGLHVSRFSILTDSVSISFGYFMTMQDCLHFYVVPNFP